MRGLGSGGTVNVLKLLSLGRAVAVIRRVSRGILHEPFCGEFRSGCARCVYTVSNTYYFQNRLLPGYTQININGQLYSNFSG